MTDQTSPPEPVEDRRRQSRRSTDPDPLSTIPTMEEMGRLATLAGARVAALEDIGADIAALSSGVAALTEAIKSLATKEEVEASSAEQDRKRRRTVTIMVAAGVVAVGLLALPSILVFVALGRLQAVADSNNANGRVLIECTTASPPSDAIPEGDDGVHECFERSQAQTAAAIATLTFSTLDAAICARTEADPARLEECFLARQAQRSPTTSTSNP